MNMHHRRAVRLFATVIAMGVVIGVVFGYSDHVGPWGGVYFALATVTTVGYGDVVPHGWAAHVLAAALMVLVIPLWTAAFSFVTAGLTADHVDKRHEELKERLPR